jgi:hypothetical protein
MGDFQQSGMLIAVGERRGRIYKRSNERKIKPVPISKLASGAFPLALFLLSFFAVYHLVLIPSEEDFLKERFGKEFDLYSYNVAKYVPIRASWERLSFGSYFPGFELATIWAILLVTVIFEWLESPLHRSWLLSLSRLIHS